MRKGTATLKHLMVAACTFCLLAWCAEPVAAAELEETDSGAPSASVLFPTTGKPVPVAGVMRPVVFNHLIHERAISDCDTCHHTGDPESCSDCHTLTGSPEGNGITLERAMHARDIAPRASAPTPSSCVSCHERTIASKKECMGCHSIVKPAYDSAWCSVCHNAELTPEQLAQGTAGTLSSDENLEIAAKAVAERAEAPQLPAFFAPTKVTIDTLQDHFKPCLFSHRRHAASLYERIKDDKLARAFHYRPEVICSACHHNSPLSMHPPKCSSCHEAKIDPADPGRPSLKAAYHLQCMGCHAGMDVARPVDTDCTACHKPGEHHAPADQPAPADQAAPAAK